MGPGAVGLGLPGTRMLSTTLAQSSRLGSHVQADTCRLLGTSRCRVSVLCALCLLSAFQLCPWDSLLQACAYSSRSLVSGAARLESLCLVLGALPACRSSSVTGEGVG